MIRQFKNFLFGKLSGSATQYYDGTGLFSTPPGAQIYKVGITIDGGGSAITTGIKGYTSIPKAGNIVRARMMADQAGAAVVDVWKDIFANYPPTVADTITAAAKPTLAGPADHSDDTTLTGWTVAVAVGDVLGFKVDSATTITRLTLELWIQP